MIDRAPPVLPVAALVLLLQLGVANGYGYHRDELGVRGELRRGRRSRPLRPGPRAHAARSFVIPTAAWVAAEAAAAFEIAWWTRPVPAAST